MSRFLQHEACPQCGSRDNLARFDDGHGYCFGCMYYEHSDGEAMSTANSTWENGTFQRIQDRGISEKTCRFFGVTVAEDGTIIFPYHRGDTLIAQSLRKPGKEFRWLKEDGLDMKELPLFGMQKYKPGGKRVVVTEGCIDAMSIAELQQCKWPVVSIPGGAAAAKHAIRSNLEWLDSFEQVVFCFDSDEPGRKAAHECAEYITPGKAYIVSLPRKDANEMLQCSEGQALLDHLWNGKSVSPSGIVAAKDVKLDGKQSTTQDVILWPWDVMNRKLYARRSGELIMIGAGTGIGKSTWMRELISHDLKEGHKVGVLMLEEGVKDTLHDLMSLHLNKPIRKIMAARSVNDILRRKGKDPIDFQINDDLTDEEYKQAYKELVKDNRLFLYDHFGSTDGEGLVNKIKFMVKGLGCKTIYLDHISIVISGNDSGDERKDIDVLMTNLRSLVEETDCNLVAVTHLRKSNGKPYEEGGRVTGQDLRGSGSIGQLSDIVIALERDQQASDKNRRHSILARVIKDRFTGYTGSLTAFRYDEEEGRVREIGYEETEDGTIIFEDEIREEVSQF